MTTSRKWLRPLLYLVLAAEILLFGPDLYAWGERALYGERWSRIVGERAEVDDSWLRGTQYIAHAMGGIDGTAYTNSRAAFDQAYARGFRVFEVDLARTRDDSLVASHAWDRPFAWRWRRPRYATFMRTRVEQRYAPLDIRGVLSLLAQHSDAWLVLDVKDDYSGTLRSIVAAAQDVQPSVLQRIIPQLYHERHLAEAEAIHSWPSYIYTLYRTTATDDEVIRFASANRIPVVAMSHSRFSSALAQELARRGVRTFVHTVNRREALVELLAAGAAGVYTDELFVE